MMYIEEICDNNICVGCGNCMNSCPIKAIKMNPDNEGFLVPSVDHKLCVNCGKCERNCPTEGLQYTAIQKLPQTVLVRSINEELLKDCASGGICTLLASYFIKELSGYVCGAVYDDHHRVKHIVTNDINDEARMQHSKYTQSDFENCVVVIKALLEEGKYVLVVGTACQIYAVKKYVGNDYDNLVGIDVICHGVPSPLVQEEYIKYLENKNGKVSNINNRYKKLYPHSYVSNYSVKWENGKESIKRFSDDPMGVAFFNHLAIRKSCHNCQFKTLHRISDLTIGDFWFSEQYGFGEDKCGINLCLIQSHKGEKYLDAINSMIEIKNIDSRTAIVLNGGMLYRSCPENKNRQKFFDNLGKMKFDELVKQYDGVSKKSRVKYCFREIIAPILRRTRYYNKVLVRSAKAREKRVIPEEKKGLMHY